MNFLIYSVPLMIFQKFPHATWLPFSCFHPCEHLKQNLEKKHLTKYIVKHMIKF